jgi:hypothetical protein
LSATAVSAHEADLSWTGSPGATGYNVFRSTNGTSFTKVASDVPATSYLDSQYLRIPGSGSVSTPNSSALDITGDIDIRVQVALDNWSASGYQQLTMMDPGSGDNRAWQFDYLNGGLTFYYFDGGDNAGSEEVTSTTTLGFTPGSTNWVRVTRVASTGVVAFYISQDGINWTQLGSSGTTTSGPLFASTAPLTIGTGWIPMTGDVYSAQVLSGINGTTVASPNFATASGTSFSDAGGNTWSIGASASLQGGPALSPSTTYYYEVQAVGGGGSSGYSNMASTTTPIG